MIVSQSKYFAVDLNNARTGTHHTQLAVNIMVYHNDCDVQNERSHCMRAMQVKLPYNMHASPMQFLSNPERC